MDRELVDREIDGSGGVKARAAVASRAFLLTFADLRVKQRERRQRSSVVTGPAASFNAVTPNDLVIVSVTTAPIHFTGALMTTAGAQRRFRHILSRCQGN